MRLKLFTTAIAIVICATLTTAQTPQGKEAARKATRERLGQLLTTSGAKKDIEIAFRPSSNNPYNFVGVKRNGLTNAESLKVVVGVSNDNTIGFRIYPSYNGAYINVDKARDASGLMRKLLSLSNQNFLFWGADDTGDIFAGYTFTLESGFPDKSIEIVLYSIAPLDPYIGQMRPFIDP